MLELVVAHGGSGPVMFVPLFTPLVFGAMLYYFVKKNPRRSDSEAKPPQQR